MNQRSGKKRESEIANGRLHCESRIGIRMAFAAVFRSAFSRFAIRGFSWQSALALSNPPIGNHNWQLAISN